MFIELKYGALSRVSFEWHPSPGAFVPREAVIWHAAIPRAVVLVPLNAAGMGLRSTHFVGQDHCGRQLPEGRGACRWILGLSQRLGRGTSFGQNGGVSRFLAGCKVGS